MDANAPSAEDIARVRRFNRVVTQRVGALNDDYLRRGRPLGEARLIYEIGCEGADVAELRSRLGLDSGYASRLLASLQEQGVLTVERAPGDGRRRRAVLTARGLDERSAYDQRSDALARDLLIALAPADRARLTQAMGEVERLVRSAAVVVAPEPCDSADARACLAAYFHELDQRFEGGFAVDDDVLASDRQMAPPQGVFLLARLDGRPVGCGGLKWVDGEIAEIKRVWTAPEARGLGVARRLMAALEDLARRAGRSRIRLDTNRVLAEAQAMYRALGYNEIARFNDDPCAHHWFGKAI